LNAALGIICGVDATLKDVGTNPINAACTSSAAVVDCENERMNDNTADADYTQPDEISDEESDDSDSVAHPDYTPPDEISDEESDDSDSVAHPDYTQPDEISDEESDEPESSNAFRSTGESPASLPSCVTEKNVPPPLLEPPVLSLNERGASVVSGHCQL